MDIFNVVNNNGCVLFNRSIDGSFVEMSKFCKTFRDHIIEDSNVYFKIPIMNYRSLRKIVDSMMHTGRLIIIDDYDYIILKPTKQYIRDCENIIGNI